MSDYTSRGLGGGGGGLSSNRLMEHACIFTTIGLTLMGLHFQKSYLNWVEYFRDI